jgi:hypothetical protein
LDVGKITCFFFFAALRFACLSVLSVALLDVPACHLHNSSINLLSFQIGERTATILKHLLPVPKPDSKRIITFANRDDYISFRSILHYLVSYGVLLSGVLCFIRKFYANN